MGLTSILEFFARVLKIWVGTAWGRASLILIGGGVLSITSIVQYLVPPIAKAISAITITIPDTPPWLSLILIVLGILVLVLSRLVPDRSQVALPDAQPNPHDVQLLSEYRALITSDLIRFLTEHSFRLPFRVALLEPLEMIAYEWRGAHRVFLDIEMQQALSDVTGAARGLCGVTTNHIFLDDRNQGIGSPLTHEDRQIGIQQATLDAIEKMNNLAKAVVTTANNFERLARQKMPN